MAGDIGIREQILILPAAGSAAEAAPSIARSLTRGGGRIMHQYGERVLLAEVPPGAEANIAFESMSAGAALEAAVPGDLTETDELLRRVVGRLLHVLAHGVGRPGIENQHFGALVCERPG